MYLQIYDLPIDFLKAIFNFFGYYLHIMYCDHWFLSFQHFHISTIQKLQ